MPQTPLAMLGISVHFNLWWGVEDGAELTAVTWHESRLFQPNGLKQQVQTRWYLGSDSRGTSTARTVPGGCWAMASSLDSGEQKPKIVLRLTNIAGTIIPLVTFVLVVFAIRGMFQSSKIRPDSYRQIRTPGQSIDSYSQPNSPVAIECPDFPVQE
jgi:hypothetical protein